MEFHCRQIKPLLYNRILCRITPWALCPNQISTPGNLVRNIIISVMTDQNPTMTLVCRDEIPEYLRSGELYGLKIQSLIWSQSIASKFDLTRSDVSALKNALNCFALLDSRRSAARSAGFLPELWCQCRGLRHRASRLQQGTHIHRVHLRHAQSRAEGRLVDHCYEIGMHSDCAIFGAAGYNLEGGILVCSMRWKQELASTCPIQLQHKQFVAVMCIAWRFLNEQGCKLSSDLCIVAARHGHLECSPMGFSKNARCCKWWSPVLSAVCA